MSLSAGPIELQFATGTSSLLPRESLPLSSVEAADPQLRRLVAAGAIRLVGEQA
jgi:hypothetical protein